jgi:hypothetical protein
MALRKWTAYLITTFHKIYTPVASLHHQTSNYLGGGNNNNIDIVQKTSEEEEEEVKLCITSYENITYKSI